MCESRLTGVSEKQLALLAGVLAGITALALGAAAWLVFVRG